MQFILFCILIVLPHIPNRKLSEGALLALELVGVPVLSSLPMEKDKQLAAAIGAQYTSDSEVLEEWLSGGISSTLPPTWRSLYEVLRELDMEELSQQIEEYLSCKWGYINNLLLNSLAVLCVILWQVQGL